MATAQQSQVKQEELTPQQIKAIEREEAISRLQHYVLEQRDVLAMAMAKAKDQIDPYLLHLERNRKLIPADRLDLEEIVFALREAVYTASVAISPSQVAKNANVHVSPKAERHLDRLSRGLALAASLMNDITVQNMAREDESGKLEAEAYVWRMWRQAAVNLFRAYKAFFFITGEVHLVSVKLSRDLSDVWVNDFIEPGRDAKVKADLEKMIDGMREDLNSNVEARYELERLHDYGFATSYPAKAKIAKGIIHRLAHAKAEKRAAFVELIDSDGNIVGDYNPHANIERYVGSMAQRRARRNPAPIDVKVLVEWGKWLE